MKTKATIQCANWEPKLLPALKIPINGNILGVSRNNEYI